VRHRFWQPGGGYDRNITSSAVLRAVIDYLHANPVRRGLVARAEDWEWSSARWYAGLRPVKLEMDKGVLAEFIAASARPFWSFHSSGANWLFADGSVQFLTYDAAQTTIPKMSSIYED
jgi:prepilin-type processing-associated H-X9-DG protein